MIVGAGLAGLSAATTLAEAGRNCLLVERQPRAGGLARSLVMDGVTFDYGPHVLFPGPGPGCRLLLETLGGEPLISRRFAFAFQTGGRFWEFPNHFDVLRYPWRLRREILAGLLSPRPTPGDSAFEELAGKTGPGLYDLLFRGMLRKKTGLDGRLLHRHWLIRPDRTVHGEPEPMPRRSRLGALLGILGRLRTRYLYPAGGFETIAARLFDRYIRAGGETMLGCGPVSLERDADRIRHAVVDGRRVPVRHVVWTAPMAELHRALGLDAAPPPRAEDILLVFATYDVPRPPVRPYVYVYHPEAQTVFNRSYYPASLFRELGPTDREGICLEITPGGLDPGLDPDTLARRALADAERIGLAPAARLRQTGTLLLPSALPVYDLDYETCMARARAGIRDVENLVSVGRSGGWYFCMAPAAAEQGLRAARHALGGEADQTP